MNGLPIGAVIIEREAERDWRLRSLMGDERVAALKRFYMGQPLGDGLAAIADPRANYGKRAITRDDVNWDTSGIPQMCARDTARSLDPATSWPFGLAEVRATYDVVRVQKAGCDVEGMVWLVDKGGCVTITNDADQVCRAMHELYPGARIIYKATDGRWTELLHNEGKFAAYVSAAELALKEE